MSARKTDLTGDIRSIGSENLNLAYRGKACLGRRPHRRGSSRLLRQIEVQLASGTLLPQACKQVT